MNRWVFNDSRTLRERKAFCWAFDEAADSPGSILSRHVKKRLTLYRPGKRTAEAHGALGCSAGRVHGNLSTRESGVIVICMAGCFLLLFFFARRATSANVKMITHCLPQSAAGGWPPFLGCNLNLGRGPRCWLSVVRE